MFTSAALSTNVGPLSSEPWGSARRLDWTETQGWREERSGLWAGGRTGWVVARWVWGAVVVFQTGMEGYVRSMRSEGQQIQSEKLTPDEGRGMRIPIPHYQWRLLRHPLLRALVVARAGWELPVEGLPSSWQMGHEGRGGGATLRDPH